MLTEKDYCDYETCVALKELGYPLTSKEVHYEDKAVFVPGVLLYSAQKWLREEKKIEIVVLGQNNIGGPYYPDIFTGDGLMNRAKGYKTYEEALSEGIKEAIKLLKEEK